MAMTDFTFEYFADYDNFKMARFDTGEYGIPVNVVIDNYADVEIREEQDCRVDLYGEANDVTFFHSEEEFLAAETGYAPEAMIPCGTFPVDKDDDTFEESPDIIFVGTVRKVEHLKDDEGANYALWIQTLGMDLTLYVQADIEIEEGNIAYGMAWLFGNIEEVKDTEE